MKRRRDDVLPIWELCQDGNATWYEWTSRQLYDSIVKEQLKVVNTTQRVLLRQGSTVSGTTTNTNSSSTTPATTYVAFHLRDMTSFLRPMSTYHPPTWVIRRHFMILTIDPLHVILLHDRLFLRIPSNTTTNTDMPSSSSIFWIHACQQRLQQAATLQRTHSTSTTTTTTTNTTDTTNHTTTPLEFQDIDQRIFLHQETFELQVVHILLGTITDMHSKCFSQLHCDTKTIISFLTSNTSTSLNAGRLLCRRRRYWKTNNNSTTTTTTSSIHETFALLKNQAKELEAQFTGLLRILQDILDDEEHLALINLSRLLSHPHRFFTSAPNIPIIHLFEEEAKKPELILDYYVEQIHSLHNSLNLLLHRMKSTSIHVQFKLNKLENRFIFYTTLFNGTTSIFTLGIALFGFFGMNTSVPASTQTLIYTFYHGQTFPYTTQVFLLFVCGFLTILFILFSFLIYLMFFSPWLYGFDII